MIYYPKKLEIDHRGNYVDGFPTRVLLDGKILPECDPPMWEKSITLVSEAGEPLRVICDLGKDREGEVIEFQPEEFDFEYGELRTRIHPRYNPCKISVAGYEPKVRKVSIRFFEGELPTVNLEFIASDTPSTPRE